MIYDVKVRYIITLPKFEGDKKCTVCCVCDVFAIKVQDSVYGLINPTARHLCANIDILRLGNRNNTQKGSNSELNLANRNTMESNTQ